MKKRLFATVVAAAWAAVALLVACSSSSSGSVSTYPRCLGATGSTGAGSPACSSCLQSTCGSQSSSAQSSCSKYFACYEACQCSDLACLQECLPKVDSACRNDFDSLTSCLTQSCATQCTTVTSFDSGAD